MASLGTPLIETRNLTLHFGGLKAVDRVNFMLNTGEPGGSVTTLPLVNQIGWVMLTILRLLGFKKFEPVYDWDKPSLTAH